jgi:predicted nucleic acid-binding protein
MKPVVVLDASMALSWALAESHSPAGGLVKELMGEESQTAVVPAIFPLELVNGLRKAEQAGRIQSRDVDAFLVLIEGLGIMQDRESAAMPVVFGRILNLMRKHGLSSYDAAYLELAVRMRLPLATLDRRLHSAAVAEGVALQEEAA